MSSVVYEGKKVNSSIHDLKALSSRFPSLATRVQSLTSAMVSCKGFNHIGSGVSSTSFSGEVNSAGIELDGFVSTVRNMQVTILSYSNEDKDIQEFLDDLDRNEYKNLDLSGIESHIGVGRKLTNGFKSLAATLFTAGAGVVEGVCDFVETGADLLVLGKSAVSSIFTGTYDLFTGSDLTKKMWEETKAKVSEKKVENAFNSFYNNTEFGQSIKNNAYGFDTVRGISSGIGYTTAMIGANIVTAGLASGGQMAAAGSVSALRLATTAGVMGFSSGTEDAWADGASLGKGLLYGAANGAWEGTQWAIGAKINQYGGVGDKIASGIFKGGRGGAATRVVLDTVDSGIEGFVQPGLRMIYKDYAGDTFADKYQNAFQETGGWSNVISQAVIGGIMSAGSELMDARKILKSASDGKVKSDTATPKAAGGDGGVEYRTALASDDVFEREMLTAEMEASGNFSGSTKGNIDGGYIKTADTEFNTSTCTASTGVPSGSAKFLDGSYVPKGAANGSLRSMEKYYTGSSFAALLDSRRETLSGLDYTRFKDASQIFASNGKAFNLNELKLIIYHSEGNISRIKSAITMSDPSISASQLDRMSRDLADKLFPKSGTGANIERRILNSYIDELQARKTDTWKSGEEIFSDILTYDEVMRRKQSSSYATRLAELRAINKSNILSDDLVRRIARSDGYPETIIKLLRKEGKYSDAQILKISEGIAAKVFKNENMARVKAQYEILKGNYDLAGSLVRSDDTRYDTMFDTVSSLFRASETFSQKAKRFVFYNTVENSISSGLGRDAALQQVKLMYADAMNKVGTKSAQLSADKLFKSNSNYFGYSDNMLSQFRGTTLPDFISTPAISKYMNGSIIDRKRILADFKSLMDSQKDLSTKPGGIKNVDARVSLEAQQKFFDSFYTAAMGKGRNSIEALRVMAKILELNENGKKIFVYNDGGFAGSNNNGLSINLARTTIDMQAYGVIYHETGHFLFNNVLNKELPVGFDRIRKTALDTLYSSQNADLLKTVKSNLHEVKMFAEYKSSKALQEIIKNKGFSSVDSYKKYLTRLYSSTNISSRADMLLANTKKSGVMLQNGYDSGGYAKNFDYEDALRCANLEISQMQAKAKNAISRKIGSFTKVSSMIDSITMGQEKIWYGHAREYYETKSKPITSVFHELLADYTDLRVRNDNATIGLMYRLFGPELINSLETTYQRMLK